MLRFLINPFNVVLALIGLFAFLQYQLWFGNGGVNDIQRLNHVISASEQKNTALASRNHALQADISDLKTGKDATEEQARTELGMVKPGEKYYQIMGTRNS
jgi:cell division protein FtsB